MAWLYYLIEANLYLSLFYAFYHLVLKSEGWYVINRWYMLFTAFLSFIIPLFTVSAQVMPSEQSFTIVQHIAYEGPLIKMVPSTPQIQTQTENSLYLNWINLLPIAYFLIAFVLIFRLALQLFRIFKIYRKSDKKKAGNVSFIELEGHRNEVFSFFNWLFLHPDTYLNKVIILHEKIHIRQGHSYDVLFLELLRCSNWFNPLLPRLIKDAKLNHEYIADRGALQMYSAYDYANLLIDHAYFPKEDLSHSAFSHTQLERRIAQLAKRKSLSSLVFKSISFIPLLMLILFVAIFKIEKSYGLINLSWQKPVVKRGQQQKHGPFVVGTAYQNDHNKPLRTGEKTKSDTPILKSPMHLNLTLSKSELISGPRTLDKIATKLLAQGKRLSAKDYMLYWTTNYGNNAIRKIVHSVFSGTEAQLFRGSLTDTLYIDEGYFEIKDKVVHVATDNIMIGYAQEKQNKRKNLIVIDALQRRILHHLSNVDIRTFGAVHNVVLNPDFGDVKNDNNLGADTIATKYVDVKLENANRMYILVSSNSHVREAKITGDAIITNETNMPKEDPWQPGIIW